VADYRLSNLAESDLAGIADYTIEAFGLERARDYRDGLGDCFQRLADNPNLGRNADEFLPELKRYSHRSHEVFYLVLQPGVFIVRVLHGRMDIERHL